MIYNYSIYRGPHRTRWQRATTWLSHPLGVCMGTAALCHTNDTDVVQGGPLAQLEVHPHSPSSQPLGLELAKDEEPQLWWEPW